MEERHGQDPQSDAGEELRRPEDAVEDIELPAEDSEDVVGGAAIKGEDIIKT